MGILIPPAELPLELKKKFLQLWANNGDAISEQYAGTSALKGDYTRTGERNFTGIMKDGVKSANRSIGIFSLFNILFILLQSTVNNRKSNSVIVKSTKIKLQSSDNKSDLR